MDESEENQVELLEPEDVSYITSMATDIPDNRIEVVPSSEVTHMITGKSDDATATLKIDAVHAVISGMQEAQEKETPLQSKENTEITIKPTISELEHLMVTEPEVTSPVDEYHVDKISAIKKVDKSIVPKECLITTETEANISLADLEKDEKHFDNAKPAVTLTDAFNVSEQFASLDEQPFVTPAIKKSNAAVTFSPLVGISVLEISTDMKEGEVTNLKLEKEATSKLNFNLHESLQVGEVFVEDKSGKYYPELIVPTESARKDVLVSNQIVTEVHDVQEREGTLSALKLPPLQEAQVDFTSKDSIVVSIDELHEKEGELPLKEMPAEIKPNKDLVVHSSLNNTVTTTHIKESEFTAESLLGKKATIGINELQHKFNIEPNIQESEIDFEEIKLATGTRANIAVSCLDKNIVEEIHIHEREKDLLLKDDKQTVTADVDFKGIEPLITSETIHMTSTSDIKEQETFGKENATESFITSDAKIVSSTIVHDKEKLEEYSVKKSETVVPSLITNLPLSVTEMEASESENNLQLGKTPDLMQAETIPTHLLKTPLAQVVNTADQIDFMEIQPDLTETATEQRDLQKEITVLQTTVEEQLQKLNDENYPHTTAKTTFIGKESLNVTETVVSMTEKELDSDIQKPKTFAKMDVDASYKIAVVSEVNLRDTLTKLNDLEKNYEAAQVVSENLSSIQISENEAYDNQAPLNIHPKPDTKSITPHLISSEETLQVTEVLQHEKESQYERLIPEGILASPDVIGRPVAVLLEVLADIDLSYSEPVKRDLSKKANIENIPYKELQVSTTDFNEKEVALKDTSDVSKAKATFNIDSKQALVIEETSTGIVPTEIESPNTVQVKAKQSAVVLEAISRREIFVHSSEDVLKDQQLTHKEKPAISFTSLQAVQYDETVSVDKESNLNMPVKPDQQNADISVISRYGIETTEVLSQSDNIKATEKFSVNTNQIYPKIDEIYGKTASTEEIITNQTAETFSNESITLQKTNVTSVPNNTFEQIEIVLAEKESSVIEKLPITSVGTKNVTEMQSVMTTYVEAIDSENKFETSSNIPKTDASVEFVSFNTTINTEVMSSCVADVFEKRALDESVATVIDRDELKKSVQETEVIYGEKEEDLDNFKKDLRKALPILEAVIAKQVTEVQASENENLFKDDMIKMSTLNAQPSINEQLALSNVEIIVNQDTEDLKIADSVSSKAIKSHETQEAISKLEPFIGEAEEKFEEIAPVHKTSRTTLNEQTSLHITEVIPSETERSFDKKPQFKTENVETTLQGKNYVAISEKITLEKEEYFTSKDNITDVKSAVPRIDVLDNSLRVDETIVAEGETQFIGKTDAKPLPVNLVVHPVDSINVSQNILAEKEEDLKADQYPKLVTGEINVSTHKHVNIEISETSENENKIESSESVKPETSMFIIEPVKSLLVTEVEAEERNSDLPTTEKIKTCTPSVELQVGEHITVTEVHSREQEHSIIPEKSGKHQKSEVSFETNLPLEVHEIILKETETNLKQDKKPSQETTNISFNSQQHVTVTDTFVREKEVSLLLSNEPSTSNQHIDINEIGHITTSETVPMEGFEIFDDKIIRDERAISKSDIFKEIVSSQPETFESLAEIKTKYNPEEEKGTHELELLKSYETSEDILHEHPENISSYEAQQKTAHKTISELKSIQQTEIIVGELSKDLDYANLNKKENALQSHVVLQEVSGMRPQVLETIDTLPTTLDIDFNKATFDLETYKSYIVTNDIAHEESNTLTTEQTLPKEITKQVVEITPVQQTEIILSENIISIKPSEYNEQNIHPTPIKLEPVSQSDIFVQEKEIDTLFEKLKPQETANITLNTLEGLTVREIYQEDSQDIFTPDLNKSVTAEKSLTLHSHIQCSENIPEIKTDELKSPTVYTEVNTSATPTVITPLIITNSEILQHATDLHLQEPKTQTITKGVSIVNEVKITEEFVSEQVSQFSDKHPSLISAVSTKDEEQKYSISTSDVQFKGKFFHIVPKYKDDGLTVHLSSIKK